MRKFLIFSVFVLFWLNKDEVILGSLEALEVWSKNLFPILLPTFVMNDLFLSSGIVNLLTKYVGTLFGRIFNTNPYAFYVVLNSMLSGTPSNAYLLKRLYDKNIITDNDVTKMLSMAIFFNPMLIISFGGIKLLFISWFANLLCAFLMRSHISNQGGSYTAMNFDFNLNDSVLHAIDTLLMILGTITVFIVLRYLLPIHNITLKVLISGILELTSGLKYTEVIGNDWLRDIFKIIFISWGGISIHMQIKSILADTKFNYYYFMFSRLLTTFISIICYSFIC